MGSLNDVNKKEIVELPIIPSKSKKKSKSITIITILLIVIVIGTIGGLILIKDSSLTLDINGCNDIDNDKYRYSCYIDSAVTTKDENICVELEKVSSKFSDSCYSRLGIELGDPEKCEKIRDKSPVPLYSSQQSPYSRCKTEVAKKTGNSSICRESTSIDQKEMCYIEIAKQKGDVKICDEIETKEYSDQCYLILTRTGNNIDSLFCDKIISIQQRNMCYTEIVRKTKNITLCDNIEFSIDEGTYEYELEECKNSVN